MGILDSLFGKRLLIDRSSFSAVIPRLAAELGAIREQFVLGGVTALKSEGAPVAGISSTLEKGSELDAVLKGFQLTSIMGFAWNYLQLADRLAFDKALTDHIDDVDADLTKQYRERYLDCQGKIDLLASSLAEDIHKIWGSPEPSLRLKRALENAAITFGIVSQAATASVFGDTKAERKLKSRLRV
jgi:hypothetical protein